MQSITINRSNGILIFKVFYLIHVLLAFNCFTFKMPVLNITSYILVIIGGVIIIEKIMRHKMNVSYKFLWILLSFLGSYFVSSVLSWQYGFSGNLKTMIWMTMQFLILYWVDYEQKSMLKHEMHVFSGVVISYTTICNIIGIVMALLGYGGRYDYLDGSGTFYGFIWGRLWGCYTDPNHGGIITVVSIYIAIYFMKLVKQKYLRVILGVSVVFNFMYIVLSDSRSAKLSFVLGCFVWLCLNIHKEKEIKKSVLIMRIVMCVIITIGIYGLFGITKQVYNSFVQTIWEMSEDKEMEEPTQTIGREEDIEGDYSNRRFDIWNSGVEIYRENKMFGVSFRNLQPYAEQEMPDTYIVSNDYGKFDSFHNVLVDILASQGLIGIVLLTVFVMAVLIFVFKKLFLSGHPKSLCIQVLLVSVFVIAFDAMFISAVFYVNSPETVIFWAFLGYLIHSLNKEERSVCMN